MPRVIAFDVNETLLDTSSLDAPFARVFGNAGVRREWFQQLLLFSQAATLAGPYYDFSEIAGASLDMLASARGVALAPADRSAILNGLLEMPPHPEVAGALNRLGAAGLRLIALSNSSARGLERQLRTAGLLRFFERVVSVDSVRSFKPAPVVYQHAAEVMGVGTSDVRMVAAHAWDILGALRAGCRGAFITRPGKVLYPLGPQPDIVAPDLAAAAELILAADSDR